MELNKNHPLYRLTEEIDWPYLELKVRPTLGIAEADRFRLVTGLLYVRTMKGLTSKEVLDLWLACPHLRYFCGDDPKEVSETIPYFPGVLDMWDRIYTGKPYDSMTYALFRSRLVH